MEFWAKPVSLWTADGDFVLTFHSFDDDYVKTKLDKYPWGYPKLVDNALNAMAQTYNAEKEHEKMRAENVKRRSEAEINRSTSHVPLFEGTRGPPQGPLVTSTADPMRDVGVSADDM